MNMKKILNFILKPLFDLGLLPKLEPTGYLHETKVFIGEKENDMQVFDDMTIQSIEEIIQKVIDDNSKGYPLEITVKMADGTEIKNHVINDLLNKQLEVLEDFKYWEDDSGYPIHSISETQRISKCKELIKTAAEQMKGVGSR